MPIYRHFYVEHRTADGWVVPASFVPEPWTFECDRPFGGFAWVHPRRGWPTLFWGAEALFEMRPGPPADRRASALLRHLDRFYEYESNEDRLCWIPYADLSVDCWDADLLTVGAKIAAVYAPLFGDGQQRFPQAELRAAGATESDLDSLREDRLADKPVNAAFGKRRSQLALLPPDHPVEVTWLATIAEFVGEPHATLFKGLRQYGRDEDLRILSRRG